MMMMTYKPSAKLGVDSCKGILKDNSGYVDADDNQREYEV